MPPLRVRAPARVLVFTTAVPTPAHVRRAPPAYWPRTSAPWPQLSAPAPPLAHYGHRARVRCPRPRACSSAAPRDLARPVRPAPHLATAPSPCCPPLRSAAAALPWPPASQHAPGSDDPAPTAPFGCPSRVLAPENRARDPLRPPGAYDKWGRPLKHLRKRNKKRLKKIYIIINKND